MISTIFRSERGVALPVAAATLLVVSLLVAGAFATSIQSTGSANRDRSSKRALGAAEAGLQVANYRLNGLGPTPDKCLTDGPVNPDPNSGECPAHVVQLGNGAKVTYYVTPALPAGSTCGSVPGQLRSGIERCITATGEVNGEKRRVQTRVLTTPASPPLLTVEGIVGLKKIEIGNNALVGGNLGSNGVIDLGNNGVIQYAELAGPDAQLKGNKIEQEGPPIIKSDLFSMELPPIEGTEDACVGPVQQGCNNNAVIPEDAEFVAETRTLNLTKELVLPAGDYNFCRIDFGNNDGANLRAAEGAKVRVFVDVPDELRPGSDCPNVPGTGSIEGKNGINIGQPDDPPENLEIYVYGWPSTPANLAAYGRSQITVAKNDLNANALIYAPQSELTVGKNNAVVNGAVAAEEVYIKNDLEFNWDEDLKWVGYSSGRYDRQGWRECKKDPTDSADPESGC